MKKVVLLLLLVMSSLILLVACGSGGSTPVTPAAPLPEVSFTISSENINFGDEVIISTRIKNAVSATLSTTDTTLSVKDGDNKVLQLLASTNVTLTATNSDGKVATASGTVTVGPWDQSLNGLVNHLEKSWVVNDRVWTQNGVVVVYEGVHEDEVGDHLVFHINHTMDFYDKNNNLYWTPAGSATWNLINNETQIKWVSSGITMIYDLSVDKETLSLSVNTLLSGIETKVVTTYKIKE